MTSKCPCFRCRVLSMSTLTAGTTSKTLGYLLNRWYFADPEKTRLARVIAVSDSDAKVEYLRLRSPGDPRSAEATPVLIGTQSAQRVRDEINATRKSLGRKPVQWSRLTRHLARAGKANEVDELERSLKHADEAILAEFSPTVAGDLDDIPDAELKAATPRSELDPNDRSTLLLATVDRLMGEFEERVMLADKKQDGVKAAAAFVDKLARLPVPPSVEYDRALAIARKTPRPINVQDALFEAIGSCVAWVRHHRGIQSVEDIRLDMPLRTAPRVAAKVVQAPVAGHAQVDLFTGELEVVKPAKLGRPSYRIPLEAIPECDLPAIARVMTGTDLPALTIDEAKAIVRPFLKSPEHARTIQGIVASETAKRTHLSAPGA